VDNGTPVNVIDECSSFVILKDLTSKQTNAQFEKYNVHIGTAVPNSTKNVYTAYLLNGPAVSVSMKGYSVKY